MSAIANTVSAEGGGILNSGTLTLTHGEISNNSPTTTSVGKGGGISNNASGTAMVTTITFNSNFKFIEGGGIFFSEGGGIYNAGTLSLSGGSVVSNVAEVGGGLYNARDAAVSISGGSIQGNDALHGGGIANVGGTLTLTNSVLVVGNSAGIGGGIYHIEDGSASVTDTTINNNTADGTVSPSGQGGGIYISRETFGISVLPTLVLTNSTINANTADRHGGGISHQSGTLTLADSVVTDNIAVLEGAGIWQGSGTHGDEHRNQPQHGGGQRRRHSAF